MTIFSERVEDALQSDIEMVLQSLMNKENCLTATERGDEIIG